MQSLHAAHDPPASSRRASSLRAAWRGDARWSLAATRLVTSTAPSRMMISSLAASPSRMSTVPGSTRRSVISEAMLVSCVADSPVKSSQPASSWSGREGDTCANAMATPSPWPANPAPDVRHTHQRSTRARNARPIADQERRPAALRRRRPGSRRRRRSRSGTASTG